MQQNQEQNVSALPRTQRILERLEQHLRRPHEPSHEDFKRIVECVLDLPEAYRSIGLITIANHFVNGMGMHLLELVSTFQELASQEEISSGEVEVTLEDVLPETFQTLAELAGQVFVKSLDDLAALNNITIRLYTLSRSSTAEEAQRWLYELPTTYARQLRQAGLLVDKNSHTEEIQGEQPSTSHYIHWQSSYTSDNGRIIQEFGSNGFIASTPIAPLPEPVSVSIETDDKKLIRAA